MQIAIIGSGRVGQALMTSWQGKHEVRLAGRADMVPTAQWSEVIVLAVPWGAALSVVRALGDLGGRVLIDATNPLSVRDGIEVLDANVDGSGAEMIAAVVPTARVVKSFNQTSAENMAHAAAFARPPLMFVAGDDADARRTAATLVEDAGFEAVDAGPLAASRELEALAILWVRLASGGRGRTFAFTIGTQGETR